MRHFERTFPGWKLGVLTSLETFPAQIGLTPANTSVSVGSAGAIYDGGLFESAPGIVVAPNGILTTVATIALVMGGAYDIAVIQPGP